jgi:hypothetical protein
MSKSKWIEVVEWCTLALIGLFMLGVFLTGTDDEADRAGSSVIHLEE